MAINLDLCAVGAHLAALYIILSGTHWTEHFTLTPKAPADQNIMPFQADFWAKWILNATSKKKSFKVNLNNYCNIIILKLLFIISKKWKKKSTFDLLIILYTKNYVIIYPPSCHP